MKLEKHEKLLTTFTRLWRESTLIDTDIEDRRQKSVGLINIWEDSPF